MKLLTVCVLIKTVFYFNYCYFPSLAYTSRAIYPFPKTYA